MTRRLLQLYGVLVLATVLAMVATAVLLMGVTDADRAVIEHTLQGGVRSAVLELDAASDLEATRAELEQRFGYPVVLTADAADRPLVYTSDGLGSSFVSAPLSRGGGVRLGPLPEFEAPALERLAVLWIGVLGVAAVLAVVLVLPQVRMLRAFEAAVDRLAQGDWGSRVGTEVPAFALPLATAFDRMAGELEGHIAARRRVLQVVSHELRTPLSRVQLGADLLVVAADSGSTEDVTRRADALVADIEDLDALVDELQEFVRLERARAPEPDEWPLLALLTEVVDARRLHDHIQVVLPDGLDDATVWVDRRQFVRAVGNLVSNALRHARHTVHILAERTPGGWLVGVEDDGPGVPGGSRDRIWEPFERAVDQQVRGSGLGLAIVHRIVTDHGGTVAVGESPLGGARFTSTWPADASRVDTD